MKKIPSAGLAAAALLAATSLAAGHRAGADGTERLATPSIPIAAATAVAIGHTGLFVEPASLTVTVPADAVVKQVLLYWETGHRPGDASGDTPDATVIVNGVEVTGTLIGGPTPFYDTVQSASFRVDVTARNWFRPGTTTVTIDGLDSDEVSDGAGVIVLYDQPGVRATTVVRDGNDIAFAAFEPPRDTTVAQTVTFAPAPSARTARLTMFVASIHETAPEADARPRPATLLVTSGSSTVRIENPFADNRELEFDGAVFEVTIPPGATSLTTQLLSEGPPPDALAASLVWVAQTVTVPEPAAAATTTTTLPAPTSTLAPSTTVATTTTTSSPGDTTTTTVPEVAADVIELPRTGAGPDVGALVTTALLALSVGAVLVWRSRRRDPCG